MSRVLEGNPELSEEAAQILAIRGTKQTADGGERVSIYTTVIADQGICVLLVEKGKHKGSKLELQGDILLSYFL